MDKFLQAVEEPSSSSVEINKDRIKFFSLEINIWNYANISQAEYKNLSVEDRSSILKKYISDLSLRFPESGKICVICFWMFLSGLFEIFLACLRCFWFSFLCSFLFLERIFLESSFVLKIANLLTLIKDISDREQNFWTKTVASAYQNESGLVEVSCEKIWLQFRFFKNQTTDYNMDKVNYPENSIFHLNQGYLTIQKNKKMFYTIF